MFNAFALFRSLVIYGICLPLAIFLGYLLANPEDMTNVAVVTIILGVLLLPLLLRWHHPVLALVWNLPALLFFAPGRPALWLPVCAVSFTVSVLQYATNRKNRFLSVPTVTLPLLCLVGVVLITARLTGGIGLRSAGSDSFGGRRYVWIFASVIGYFAFTARSIPMERAITYVRMYFLGSAASMIGSLAAVATPSLYFIFLVFPADYSAMQQSASQDFTNPNAEMVRFGGLSIAATSIAIVMLAAYGIRGVFNPRKSWRIVLFLLCGIGTLFGGFRASLIFLMAVFGLQFYFEGLFRSRLFPILSVTIVLTAALALPFAERLPLSIQRTLSFLPVKIDPIAAMDAQGSIDWRVMMWQRALADVPKYLLVGKGYSLTANEFAAMAAMLGKGSDPSEGAYLSGDYHNGPLSIIVPFGIWGVITFLWFLAASTKVMYYNYLFSDPRLRQVNTLLLSYFVAKMLFFFFIFGSLYSDLAGFVGLIGLSITINGGVLGPVTAPVVEPVIPKLKLITLAR